MNMNLTASKDACWSDDDGNFFSDVDDADAAGTQMDDGEEDILTLQETAAKERDKAKTKKKSNAILKKPKQKTKRKSKATMIKLTPAEVATLEAEFSKVPIPNHDTIVPKDLFLSKSLTRSIIDTMQDTYDQSYTLFTVKLVKTQWSIFVNKNWGFEEQKKEWKRAKTLLKEGKGKDSEEIENKRIADEEEKEKIKEKITAIREDMQAIKTKFHSIRYLNDGGRPRAGDSLACVSLFKDTQTTIESLSDVSLPMSEELCNSISECTTYLARIIEVIPETEEVEKYVSDNCLANTREFLSTYEGSLALRYETDPCRSGNGASKRRSGLGSFDFSTRNWVDLKKHHNRVFKSSLSAVRSWSRRGNYIHQKTLENAANKRSRPNNREAGVSRVDVSAATAALETVKLRVASLKEQLLTAEREVRQHLQKIHPVTEAEETVQLMVFAARPNAGANVTIYFDCTMKEPLSPFLEELLVTKCAPYSSLNL